MGLRSGLEDGLNQTTSDTTLFLQVTFSFYGTFENDLVHQLTSFWINITVLQ